MGINLTTAMREVCRAMVDGAQLKRLQPGKGAELLTATGNFNNVRSLASATVKRLEEAELIEWVPLAIVGGPTQSQARLTDRGRKAGKPEIARFKAKITTPTMVAELEGPLLAMSDMLVYIRDPAERAGVIQRCVESHIRNCGEHGVTAEQLKTIRIGLHNRCQLDGASTGFAAEFWDSIEALLKLMPAVAPKPAIDTDEDRG